MLYTHHNMELAPPVTLSFPSRWTIGHKDAKVELGALAQTLTRGAEAMAGLYMRMCDLIRDAGLTDSEVREILSAHFPQPRISEILRVSRAPNEVYVRYTAGFFGFKSALKECRGYQVNTSAELNRRKTRRAAERLILLTGGSGSIQIKGKVITIT